MPARKIHKDLYLVADGMLTHPWDSTAFLVRGRGRGVLIDCGSGMGHGRLVRNMAGAGIKPEDIECVIGTHGHLDHVAGVTALRRLTPDLPLALHEDDADAVEQGDPDRTCAGWFFGASMSPERVDISFNGRKTLEAAGHRFDIIHTPGHTPGSICIRLELHGKVFVFAGDCLTPSSKRVLGDYDEWELTLDALRDLDCDVLLPGHTNQWMGNPFLAMLMRPRLRKATAGLSSAMSAVYGKSFWRMASLQYNYMFPVLAQLGARMFPGDVAFPQPERRQLFFNKNRDKS